MTTGKQADERDPLAKGPRPVSLEPDKYDAAVLMGEVPWWLQSPPGSGRPSTQEQE